MIGISPVDFVPSFQEIAHATGNFVVSYRVKSQRVPQSTPMTHLTSIIDNEQSVSIFMQANTQLVKPCVARLASQVYQHQDWDICGITINQDAFPAMAEVSYLQSVIYNQLGTVSYPLYCTPYMEQERASEPEVYTHRVSGNQSTNCRSSVSMVVQSVLYGGVTKWGWWLDFPAYPHKFSADLTNSNA